MFNAAMCCNHCSTPVLKEDTVTGITWHTSWSTPWHTRCTWPSLSCRVWQSQEPGDHQDWGRRAKNRWITKPLRLWVLVTTETWEYQDKLHHWSWCLDGRFWWWRWTLEVWMDSLWENWYLEKTLHLQKENLVDLEL